MGGRFVHELFGGEEGFRPFREAEEGVFRFGDVDEGRRARLAGAKARGPRLTFWDGPAWQGFVRQLEVRGTLR